MEKMLVASNAGLASPKVAVPSCETSLGHRQHHPRRLNFSLASMTRTPSLASMTSFAFVCAASRAGRFSGRPGRTLCKAEASDVPRRVAAVAAAAAAADAVLRRDDRYAPSGPTLWPPKAFKETQRSELLPGIWGLEQVIAFFTVSANIRMIVVRLEDGRLWVCGPISPTRHQGIESLNPKP